MTDDKKGSQSDVLSEDDHDQVTEPSDSETTTVKSSKNEDEKEIIGTMCDKYEEMKEKIRCKVIACFKDSQLCFK